MARKLVVLMVLLTAFVVTACGTPAATTSSVEPSAGASSAAPTTTAAPSEPAASATPDFAGVYADGDQIEVIVPYSPGGGADLNVRTLAPYLQTALRDLTGSDVSVVARNVTGAGGIIGAETIARADPDGMTIGLVIVQSFAGEQAIGNLPFDLTEITWLARLYEGDRAIVVRQDLDLPERSLNGLIARSADTPVLFGLQSPTDARLMQALLEDEGASFNIEAIEYGGVPEGIVALLRGDIEAFWTTTAGLVPLVEDNAADLEFLVSTGCERVTVSDVETIVEQDVPNAEAICSGPGGSMRSIYGPPGLPENVTATLRAGLEQALADQGLIDEMRAAGFDVHYLNGVELTVVIGEMVKSYAEKADILKP